MADGTVEKVREPRVLIAVDFFEPSDFALAQGFRIAHALGSSPSIVHVAATSGGQVYLDTPEGLLGMTRTEAEAFLLAHVQRRLDRFQAELGKGHFDVAVCLLRTGDPAHEIALAATKSGADVLVVGTHGRRPLKRLFVGSVAEKVIRLAPCAVYVARERSDAGPKSEAAAHSH